MALSDDLAISRLRAVVVTRVEGSVGRAEGGQHRLVGLRVLLGDLEEFRGRGGLDQGRAGLGLGRVLLHLQVVINAESTGSHEQHEHERKHDPLPVDLFRVDDIGFVGLQSRHRDRLKCAA